jgi:hypothetical protein
MELVTHVSDRHRAYSLNDVVTHTRWAGWYPRVARKESGMRSARHHAHAVDLTSALPLPAAAPPSSPKPPAPRHDLIALRRACEAQAFSAYAHMLSREEYERRDYQRATHWQRLSADATRGAIMYRELARMLLSAGRV